MTSPIVQLDTNDGLGPVMRDETERYYVLLRVGEATIKVLFGQDFWKHEVYTVIDATPDLPNGPAAFPGEVQQPVNA